MTDSIRVASYDRAIEALSEAGFVIGGYGQLTTGKMIPYRARILVKGNLGDNVAILDHDTLTLCNVGKKDFPIYHGLIRDAVKQVTIE